MAQVSSVGTRENSQPALAERVPLHRSSDGRAYHKNGFDHGVGHFRPLSITRQRHLLVYHFIAMSHEGLCQVF
jgi:hypothetical protein